MKNEYQNLITEIKNEGVLKSERLEWALRRNNRGFFVKMEDIDISFRDIPLSTLEEQTTSQPSTIIFMLEKLNLNEGDRVLEIGFGSGWQTKIISDVVGEKGHVYGYEINREIFKFGSDNLSGYNLKNVTLFNKSYEKALGKKYDKIISGASLEIIDNKLLKSLNPGGIAVLPFSDGTIKKFQKTKNDLVIETYFGYVFVPIKK